MDKPKFKKVEASETQCDFKAVTNAEIIKAVADEVRLDPESDAPDLSQKEVDDLVDDKPDLVDRILADAKESKLVALRNPTNVRAMRRNDRHFNHTCAQCLKRKDVSEFYRGKNDNVCIACGAK